MLLSLGGRSEGEGSVSWMLMRMGRWSEFRRVAGCHTAARARCALQKVRSGEEGAPRIGRRVDESVLSKHRELFAEACRISSPLATALSSTDGENHAWLWALKSPTTRVSHPKSLSKRETR